MGGVSPLNKNLPAVACESAFSCVTPVRAAGLAPRPALAALRLGGIAASCNGHGQCVMFTTGLYPDSKCKQTEVASTSLTVTYTVTYRANCLGGSIYQFELSVKSVI